jgi:hypothetical protein
VSALIKEFRYQDALSLLSKLEESGQIRSEKLGTWVQTTRERVNRTYKRAFEQGELEIRRGDKVLGPFPPGKIKQMIADGKITQNDLIRADGGDQWNSIRDIPNLAKLFGPEIPSTTKRQRSLGPDLASSDPQKMFVKRGDTVRGPLTLKAVQDGIAAGKIDRSDQIGARNTGPWKRAESFWTLFPAVKVDNEGKNIRSKTALTACEACAKQVSPKATVCPHCGVPNPGGLKAQLVVRRIKALVGVLGIMGVFVDGLEIGQLKNGEELSVDLAPGPHELQTAALFLSKPQQKTNGMKLNLSVGSKTTVDVRLFKAGFADRGYEDLRVEML